MKVNIHKIIVDFPMTAKELSSELREDVFKVRRVLMEMQTQGLITSDKSGNFHPNTNIF